MVKFKLSNNLIWINGSRLGSDGQDFFTSYDEVYDTFDAMGLQENLLRGIYAYGKSDHAVVYSIGISWAWYFSCAWTYMWADSLV